MKNILNKVLVIISYIPYIWIVLLYSYCIRIIFDFGTCPNKNITEPEYIYKLHYTIFENSFKYGLYLIGFFILFAILRLFKIHMVKDKDMAVFIIGLVLFIISLIFPLESVWVMGD